MDVPGGVPNKEAMTASDTYSDTYECQAELRSAIAKA